MTIGERRKAARLAAGLSLRQAAKLEGVSAQAIYARERAVLEGPHRGPFKKTVNALDNIRMLANAGLDRVQIANALDMSYSQVCYLAKRYDIAVKRKPGTGLKK